MINDIDTDFRGQGECPLGEFKGDGGQVMGLSTLISGYIPSALSIFLPVPRVAIILAPAIGPVGLSAATPLIFLAEPL